ncbi:MAG TPA: glutamate--tRNA ligase family protein [Opitutaceae bacterium]|jgi:glutamyl-tRNA synthetase|nr:glutamate--tRNA ligase family protein [Opitutaceae bacterium]
MSQVRVRFAPSPTGFFHIGSARTALFNWLYARHTGGVFILRVEDTDHSRNSEEFLNVIYNSLKWLGLNWDEGPGIGGDCGPFRQSERAAVYKEYLERLKASGRTYEKDGATLFKISGEPQVIEDAIRGRVERTEEKDFVIVRSDGNPVFHFVNVVDDIAMRVTHVIRGEDHLSNTSKHTELFKALGAPLPIYAHIPLILKQNGPGKMSKRDQGALIEEYQKRGFIPEALVNFLCLLGWSPKEDREKLPMDEIIRLFDLPGINQSNARFDEKKLAHMNGVYLHEMAPDGCFAFAKNYLASKGFFTGAQPEDAYLRDVVLLCQPKIRSFEDLPGFIGYFFGEDFAIDPKAREKVFTKGDPKARIQELLAALPAADFSSDAALEALVQGLATQNAAATADYIHPTRLALSGSSVGPSFYGLLRVLGRERVSARIGRFLATA